MSQKSTSSTTKTNTNILPSRIPTPGRPLVPHSNIGLSHIPPPPPTSHPILFDPSISQHRYGSQFNPSQSNMETEPSPSPPLQHPPSSYNPFYERDTYSSVEPIRQLDPNAHAPLFPSTAFQFSPPPPRPTAFNFHFPSSTSSSPSNDEYLNHIREAIHYTAHNIFQQSVPYAINKAVRDNLKQMWREQTLFIEALIKKEVSTLFTDSVAALLNSTISETTARVALVISHELGNDNVGKMIRLKLPMILRDAINDVIPAVVKSMVMVLKAKSDEDFKTITHKGALRLLLANVGEESLMGVDPDALRIRLLRDGIYIGSTEIEKMLSRSEDGTATVATSGKDEVGPEV